MNGHSLLFRETALAKLRHPCSPLRLELRVGGDSVPYSRILPVLHRVPICDEMQVPVIEGVFVNGEMVQVGVAVNGEFSLYYPDRFSWLIDRHPDVSVVLSDGFRVPESGVDISPGSVEGVPCRVRLRRAPLLIERFDRWDRFCQ